ncbi:hypothetical protein H5410_045471 [Solanum commersonii]|uniref:Uncharacterized protein n=1 Tax=Solanum commersonii TaxID=4109 RepID=A0A9J5XBQ2_SOLCO|nr:hypothetical protein H5410_045471 [Solanum commersonii]
MPKWWYLQPFDNTSNSTDLSEPELSGLLHLLTALVLYDKTGTLTCNRMDFLKCSIAGLQYGTRASNVELAAAKQSAVTWPSGQFFFPSSNSDVGGQDN